MIEFKYSDEHNAAIKMISNLQAEIEQELIDKYGAEDIATLGTVANFQYHGDRDRNELMVKIRTIRESAIPTGIKRIK